MLDLYAALQGISREVANQLGRSRKKKCDERGSPCQNCLKRNIECIWPGSRASHVHERPSPESSSIAAESISGTECQLVNTRTPFIIAFSNAPAWYSPALTRANSQLFGFLQTIFLPQLIHPVTKGAMNELVTRESLRWAFQSPFCMHALLACAAAEIPVHNPQYRRMAELHYIKAVAGLRQSLIHTSDPNQWTVVLWTVLILCIYEVSRRSNLLINLTVTAIQTPSLARRRRPSRRGSPADSDELSKESPRRKDPCNRCLDAALVSGIIHVSRRDEYTFSAYIYPINYCRLCLFPCGKYTGGSLPTTYLCGRYLTSPRGTSETVPVRLHHRTYVPTVPRRR